MTFPRSFLTSRIDWIVQTNQKETLERLVDVANSFTLVKIAKIDIIRFTSLQKSNFHQHRARNRIRDVNESFWNRISVLEPFPVSNFRFRDISYMGNRFVVFCAFSIRSACTKSYIITARKDCTGMINGNKLIDYERKWTNFIGFHLPNVKSTRDKLFWLIFGINPEINGGHHVSYK